MWLPSGMCEDVRNKRGTPGLVPYDKDFAFRQLLLWNTDSFVEQMDEAYADMCAALANAKSELERAQILEDNK